MGHVFLARSILSLQSLFKGLFFVWVWLFAIPASLLGQSWAAATGVVDPSGATHVHVSSAGNVFVDASSAVPTTGRLRYNLFQAGIDARPLESVNAGKWWSGTVTMAQARKSF